MASLPLKDQIVWVTGSAKRVGRVVALACADAGADIVVHCHKSREEAEEVRREVERKGRRGIVVQGDQGSREDALRMVEEIRGGMGGLSALVNSAATFPQSVVEEVTEEDFFAVVRTNLYGPFVCTQAALPLLREAKPGRVVNITDSAVVNPYNKYAHYMAAKGGLRTLTKALARELAPEVMVNEIAPGPVLEPPGLEPERRARTLARVPLGRWGTPEAVAQAVVYLLSADYLCGTCIEVDGGRHIG